MSVKANKSLDDGLVLYVPMNEGSGSTVYDRSKNGNNGAITSATWVIDAEKGKCLSFDGVNDYVLVPYNSVFNFRTGNFSLCAWVKFTTQTSGEHIIIRRDTSSSPRSLFGFVVPNATPNSLRFHVYDMAIPLQKATTSIDCGDGEWHFVVGVRDGDNIVLYVDGVAGTPTTGCSVLDINIPDGNLAFARYTDTAGAFFDGEIKDVKIYNRALTETEVSALYRLGENKSLSDGLVLDMPLNEGSGSTAFDKSKYSNNGEINGATWVVDEEKGKCLSFDGLDDKVEIPANSAFDVAEFSIYAEIYVEDLTTNFEIFGREMWNYQRFYINPTTNWLYLTQSYSGVSQSYHSQVSIELNKWYSVCVTMSASKLKFYIDGVFKKEWDISGIDVGSGVAKIGYHNTNFSNGKIRNVRFYNRGLSASEIKQLYRLTKKGVE